ncbi:MAG: hypothetical protein COS87_00715 [Chloroflexi bacterium CG07_land_8_20_14_0_80_45_17]|nr:MAG: hypothetical protein COS87_00715 [Chloroflexi bacterium CG07_land_8_20_14_0_80_45_17]
MKIIKEQKGQALPIVLILLVVGGLLIVPTLNYASTSLKGHEVVESRTLEIYAADAGVEDAAYKILTNYDPFASLAVEGSYTYSLTDPINDLPVSAKVTKLSLIADFIGDDEYKVDQPHESWVTFNSPAVSEATEDYVEYSCDITFHYGGVGNRVIETIGAFFTPGPGSQGLIVGPYEIVYTPVITSQYLEAGSPELATGANSFAFIWRWPHNQGPQFTKTESDGALSFKFRVLDSSWTYGYYFIWATFKEQDISYVTNAPDIYNWQVEATAGDTKVTSYIIGGPGKASILTWEID